MADPIDDQTVPTEEMAKELSKILGCTGAHKIDDGKWGPCPSREHLDYLIKNGSPAYREWVAARRKSGKKMFLVVEGASVEYTADDVKAGERKLKPFKSRQAAELRAKEIGCSGAHQNGQGRWFPCQSAEELNAHRANPSRVARLAEARRRQEVESYDYAGTGIETLPGGGLVSGKIGRSDSFKPTGGMVEEAERGLEWRREFGRGGTSVGISRARDIKNGKNLPYATVKRVKAFFDRHQSDKEAEGWRPGEKGYPSNGRIAHALWGGDAGYTWAKDIVERVEKAEMNEKAARGGDPKTPAKPSERISGSRRNKPGSASGTRGGIKLSDSVIKSLENKVKEHNEKMEKQNKGKGSRATLGALKAVWRRGAGAFSSTHRPGMGRQQWAMGRVNAYLHLLSTGKPKNAKYTTDNDLLPKEHKRSTKKK